jgi:hypothetical protein
MTEITIVVTRSGVTVSDGTNTSMQKRAGTTGTDAHSALANHRKAYPQPKGEVTVTTTVQP